MRVINRAVLVTAIMVGGLAGQRAQASYSTMSTADLLAKLSSMQSIQANRATESLNYATQAEALAANATTAAARQSALVSVSAWLSTVSNYETQANAAVNEAGVICLVISQRGNLTAYNQAMVMRANIAASRDNITKARVRLSNVKSKLSV